jgi:hypothetical protein
VPRARAVDGAAAAAALPPLTRAVHRTPLLAAMKEANEAGFRFEPDGSEGPFLGDVLVLDGKVKFVDTEPLGEYEEGDDRRFTAEPLVYSVTDTPPPRAPSPPKHTAGPPHTSLPRRLLWRVASHAQGSPPRAPRWLRAQPRVSLRRRSFVCMCMCAVARCDSRWASSSAAGGWVPPPRSI